MPPTQIGKYKVTGVLGKGGMGEVYLGEDSLIGRAVAIKLMMTGTDEDRFLREARIIGGFSHPNIVVLYDFGFHENRPYLVMEHLAGVSLAVWLKEPHALREHLRIIEGLCSALTYAHERDVLHRDLKPLNVQVLPDGRCKLVDFGIAREPIAGFHLAATGTRSILGTPGYLPPEILMDAPYSVQADVYSAGLVFYEILAGTNPFLGSNLPTTLNSVLNVRPANLADLRADVPRELTDAIMSCLAKDPRGRPNGLAEVGNLASLGLMTPLVTPLQPAARAHERSAPRKSLVALAALGGVGLLVLGTLWVFGPTGTPMPPAPPGPTLSNRPVPAPESQAPTTIRAMPAPERTGPSPVPSSPRPSVSPPRSRAAAPPANSAQPSPEAALPEPPVVTPPRETPAVAAPEPDASPMPETRPQATSPPERHEPGTATASEARDAMLTSLTSLTPRTIRRKTSVVFELRGKGLRKEDRATILLGRQEAEGIRITRQQIVDETLARITVTADEDVPFGMYWIVLKDARGHITNRLSLEVIL